MNTKEIIKMTPEEALALKVQCNLSDDSYQMIRNAAKEHNSDIFPSLHKIFEVKSKCYPPDLSITETSAKSSLQSMVNHTLTRIISLVNHKLEMLDENNMEGTFYCKTGFDGASSQKVYKQAYQNTDINDAKMHEESLFQSAFVPLKLKIGDEDIWVNVKPNSSHFCRPLHLQYQKESKELSKAEFTNLKEELSNVEPFLLIMDNDKGRPIRVKINFKLDFTMFDGKVVNALTDTLSTQSCNICGAKPSEMNSLEKIRSKTVNYEACSLAISSLHCWIRGFEYILHIGYKLSIKKHQARTPEDKLTVQNQKQHIQKRFREELSLIVDCPKVGHGNTNDGNTSRRAFSSPAIFSSITGVDIELIQRLHNILIAITSGYDLNTKNFQKYCDDTLCFILDKYSWYIIPPSVHKLLVHGSQIADALELPIGQYSEEAQEAQNKELRNARLNHACKISRLNVMKNQFHYMLIRTDPVISSISFVKHKNSSGKPLPEEVKILLN